MFLTRLAHTTAINDSHHQIALISLSVLTPHPYNPVSSLIFPHTGSPHTVPESYYDVPGLYETIDSNTSTRVPDQPPQRPRANATLLMLARNSDVDDAVRAVRELEDRFNHKHRYPWVFLNEQPFSDDFKRYVPLTLVLPSLILYLLPLTVVFTRTRMHSVAYRLSSRVPCILGRFPRSIGINLRGLMRPRRKSRERRWRRRVSSMVAVYRAAILFSYFVLVVMTGAAHRYRNMCRFNSGVRFCPPLIRQ